MPSDGIYTFCGTWQAQVLWFQVFSLQELALLTITMRADSIVGETKWGDWGFFLVATMM